MNKIRYSKDVDALLIELSQQPIAYAEEQEQVILHFAEDGTLVLIEVLDVKEVLSEEFTNELLPIP
jgi:uncharacterized protein YuzE